MPLPSTFFKTLGELVDSSGVLIFLIITITIVGVFIRLILIERWNIFTTAKALSDNERTLYQQQGDIWFDLSTEEQNEIKNAYQLEQYLGVFKKTTWRGRYRKVLSALLTKINRWCGDSLHITSNNKAKGFPYSWFSCNPFTGSSYELCLVVAIFYPFFFFSLSWLIGGSGEAFGLPILKANAGIIERLPFFMLMVVAVLVLKEYKETTYSSRRIFYFIVFWACFFVVAIGTAAFVGNGAFGFAFTGAFAIAIAIAIDFAIAVIIAFAFAFAVAVAGAFSGIFAGAIAGAIAGAVAVAFAIIFAKTYMRTENRIVFWFSVNVFILFITAFMFLLVFSFSENVTLANFIPLIFFVLLPLQNGLLDWLSLGFTRGLLTAFSARTHKTWQAFGWVLGDVILAFIFMLMLVGLTVATIAGINVLIFWLIEATLLDLNKLFRTLKYMPFSADILWIHLMMFSTLLPTLVHFAVISFASYDFWMTKKTNEDINAILNGSFEVRKKVFFQYLIAANPLSTLILPIVMIVLLVALLSSHHALLGNKLFEWALWVAESIDPTIDRAFVFAPKNS